MTRSSVPSQYRTNGPSLATPKQASYICALLDERQLTASPAFFDTTNAMDHEELDAYILHLKARASTVTKARASTWIDGLRQLPKVRRQAEAREARSDVPGSEAVPAGHYAVNNEEGELRFYHVWRGTRNPSYVKLYVEHGPDDSEVPFRAAVVILGKIAEDMREAALRYGREIGCCSKCRRRLTNRVSRELGIGPVCGGRMFGDEFKAEVAEARQAIVARGEDPDEEVA